MYKDFYYCSLQLDMIKLSDGGAVTSGHSEIMDIAHQSSRCCFRSNILQIFLSQCKEHFLQIPSFVPEFFHLFFSSIIFSLLAILSSTNKTQKYFEPSLSNIYYECYNHLSYPHSGGKIHHTFLPTLVHL